MGKGFVKIPRRIFDTKWWHQKRIYSESDAIIDLYQSAGHNNMYVTSVRVLAEKWLWEQTKVFRFIAKLSKEGYICANKTVAGTTIEILDFGIGATPTATQTATQSAKHPATPKRLSTSSFTQVDATLSATPTATQTAPPSATNNNIYRYIDNNIPPISPKGEREKTSKFVKPTIEEIQAYITEKGYDLNAQQIFDHYEMVGWVYGRGHNPIKDWKAAVRTWNRNSDKARQLPLGFNLKDNSPNKYDNDIPGW